MPLHRVAAFFKSNIPELGIKANKLALNGAIIPKQNIYSSLLKSLHPDKRKDFFNKFTPEEVNEFHSPAFNADLGQNILQLFASHYNNEGEIFYNDSIKTPLSKLQYIYIVDEPKTSFLYDPMKNLKLKPCQEAIKERIKQILGDGSAEWYAEHTIDCTKKYLPYNSNRIIDDEENQCRYFNIWREAEWRKGWYAKNGVSCPPELLEFIDTVVCGGNQESENRRAVWAWTRDAIFTRAFPIIILRGVQGLGKNLYTDLLGEFIGDDNYEKASAGFESSKFHSSIVGCTIFFMDETALNKRLRELLKNYHSPRAGIEGKGVESRTENIHASFVLANNAKSDIKMDYADRKFFIPDLNPTPLLQTLGQQKITRFAELIKNFDFLRDAASYLFYNFKEGDSKNFPKTVAYREICEASYPMYFKRIKTLCENNEIVTYKMFQTRGQHTDIERIDDYMKHYETNFGISIGEILLDKKGFWSIKSHIFNGSASDEDVVL